MTIYSVQNDIYATLPSTSITNGEYVFWHPYWRTIRDCIMGEIMVKRRKTMYLPKMETQSDTEYDNFLMRATYYNATARTVNGLVGSVHMRPPLIDNLPDSVDLSNVTRDGSSFEMFCKRITREIVSVSRFGVLLDAPERGGTPYFAGYEAEDIIDWSVRKEADRDIVEYVVLREVYRNKAPFPRVSDLTETYRVLLLDEGGIYRQRVFKDGNIESVEYVEVTPTIRGQPLRYIPFWFVSPSGFDAAVEKPSIIDIALLNLSHYRSYAQLEQGRFYTATPIYATFLGGGGDDDDVEYKVGPNTVWQLGAGDKAEILEFKGDGLKSLENALVMKEQQIAALGGKFASATRGVAAESTESVSSRERSEASLLQSTISTMSELASRMLTEFCRWNGTPADVEVRFATDVLEMYITPRELKALESLYNTGILPIEILYAVFRNANIIPPQMSMDEFKALLPDMTPKTEQKLIETEETAKIDKKYAPPLAPVAQQPPNPRPVQ